MSSHIEEEILERLRALPVAKQEEVLKFTESLAKDNQPKRMSIFEQVDQIAQRVSPEAWDEVPSDGSINVDHYLYGAPKRK
jgi:hypothetical protein